jgi:fatty acid desaturase
MVALAATHGAFLMAFPTLPAIALGLWWNANTISHSFIHRPFFKVGLANRLLAAYLSLLLGFPQALWRDRHLAHHAGREPRLRVSSELISQVALVLSLWTAIAVLNTQFWIFVYLPGYLAGLGLCALHGYYEHARGATSHYGALYNTLFFNDGFHAEHHANPDLHWTRLRERREPGASVSAWPAPFRWLEMFSLESLKRLLLR